VRGDVVDEDGAGRASVVGTRDGAEALCSGCVPELEAEECQLTVISKMVCGTWGDAILAALSASSSRLCQL
jgi:hypothetical protein